MRMSLKAALFTLFFVSGFCGLLYQVVWVRLAFASFGIVTPVLSVVISVFMLGLALGSWAGGTQLLALTSRMRVSAIFSMGLLSSESALALWPSHFCSPPQEICC